MNTIDGTYRTSELDVLFAGGAIWVVLGPNFADDAELADTFDRIAAGGPQNRVGLLPSRSTRRWRIVEQPGKGLVLPPCPVACNSFEEVTSNALKVRPDVPVAAWRCGEYLCIYCDHGLGDGSYIARLVAAITNPAALASFDPAEVKVTRHPFGLAFWTGLRSQPGQLLRDAGQIGRSILTRLRTSVRANRQQPIAAVDSDLAAHLPTAEDVRVVWVSSGPSYLTELRAYRDTAHPGVSTTVLAMFAICKSLRSVVDEMSSDVEILADMRRFLPKGSTIFGNFAAVVTVPLSARDTPEVFSAALTKSVTSYRPLVKLLGVVSLSSLRYSLRREKFRPRWADRFKPSGDRRTKVTFIDWAKFPADARPQWPDMARAELAGMTPPGSREHIAIVLTSPGNGRVQVTARFHETHIDRERVRATLEQALSATYLPRLDDAESGGRAELRDS